MNLFGIKALAIVFFLLIIGLITYFVKKDKIIIKYSIIWYISSLVFIVFTLFPKILSLFTKLIGIQIASNLLFIFLIAFLFIICISLTIIVSEQKEQIRLLIQEVSLLKKDKDEKK